MEMNATRTLPVSQQQAWEALNNPAVLQACIPGCDAFNLVADNTYEMLMSLKIGPVSAKFKGDVKLSDVVAPDSYTIAFEGQGGIAGHGKGEATVKLSPITDNTCELAYTVNASVGGKIAQMGQRLIDGVAKNLAEKFFTKFEDQFQTTA